MSNVILKLTDVHTYYGHIHALKGISMDINEGEIVTLLGANGAGKSTTLSTITGLVPAREGTITFKGKDITKEKPSSIIRMGIGISPEGREVFPKLTVEENLRAGAYIRKDDLSESFDEVYGLFPRLKERTKQIAGTLSGGEQQRIALARAILKNAPIVVLDEATAFADPENEVLIQKALSVLCQDKTVIMIAHRLSTVVNADKIIVLKDGKIIEEGRHKELLNKEGLYHKMWNNYNQSVKWKITSGKEGI